MLQFAWVSSTATLPPHPWETEYRTTKYREMRRDKERAAYRQLLDSLHACSSVTLSSFLLGSSRQVLWSKRRSCYAVYLTSLFKPGCGTNWSTKCTYYQSCIGVYISVFLAYNTFNSAVTIWNAHWVVVINGRWDETFSLVVFSVAVVFSLKYVMLLS